MPVLGVVLSPHSVGQRRISVGSATTSEAPCSNAGIFMPAARGYLRFNTRSGGSVRSLQAEKIHTEF